MRHERASPQQSWRGAHEPWRGAHGHIRIDELNVLQPDASMQLDEPLGGSRLGPDGVIEGPPEPCGDVIDSAASEIFEAKRRAYAHAGIPEWIVWRTADKAVDWFRLEEGTYRPLRPNDEGVIQSKRLPGLWLHPAAMATGDGATVMAVTKLGLASREHAAFAQQIRDATASSHP